MAVRSIEDVMGESPLFFGVFICTHLCISIFSGHRPTYVDM